MQRQVKIALVITVVFWGFFGAIHNVLDWGGTLGAVGADSWQSTSNPIVI